MNTRVNCGLFLNTGARQGQIRPKWGISAALLVLSLTAACGGKGDINLANATPLGVQPTTDTGSQAPVTPSRLFTFQPGEQVSFKVLADGTEVGGSPIINDFDGDGMDNTDEVTTNIWAAEYPHITTRVVTPVTMQVQALSYQTGITDVRNYQVSGSDLTAESSTSSERFYRQTLSSQAAQYEKAFYPSGVPSGQTSDFITPGLGFLSLAGQSSGFQNGSSWSAYSQPAPVSPVNIDGGFAADVNVFNWVFQPEFSANAAAQYRIWKRDKEANSYQIDANAGTVRIAMYIKNSGSNVPVRLSNILAALVFETPQGSIITASNFRLRDVSNANLYSLEMNANTEFGPYLIEVPGISTDLIEQAIRYGYTPQIRLLDYDMTHTTNSPFRLSLNFTGDNLKVMENNARDRTAKINIIGPTARQTFAVAAFATSTEVPTDACAPVATPDATSTASPGVPLTRALDRAACSIAVGGKVGGVPVVQYQNYVLDFTGVPVYDNINPKIVYVTGIKKIGDIVNNVNCDPAYTNVCYIRFADYLTNPNNNFAIWTVFAKGQYFNYSQFDYTSTSGSGNVKGYPSGTFNSNTRVGAIPKLKGVNSTIWAGDTYDVVYLKVSDIIAMRAQPGGTPIETGVTLSYNTKWDSSTVGTDPYAPEIGSKFVGKAITGDKVELTFQLNNTKQLNYNFGTGVQGTDSVGYSDFSYTLNTLSQRFDVQKALQFEVSMALGAAKSDWVSVLDTTKLAPCNRNALGNPDVNVDFVAQRFTLCFILPKGDRSYTPPTVSADYTDSTLYSIYLRPKLLDEYRNVIWPEMRTEVRRFKANLNRDYQAGAQLIEVTDVVGPIAANDTFTLGSDTTVYTLASYAVVAANPKLANITLSTGLAYLHQAGEKLKANSAPVPTSQVTVNIGNSYFSSWNNFLAGLPSYSSNARCTGAVKNCDFFDPYSNPATTVGPMGLTYNQSNVNWVGHNLFYESVYDYNGLDASRYSGVMGLDLENLIVVPNSNPLSKLTMTSRNYVFTPTGSSDLLISNSNADLQDDPQIAISGNRAIVVWASKDNGYNFVIKGRIYDVAAGTPIGGDFQINTTDYSNIHAPWQYRTPQVAVADTKAIVVWTDSAAYYYPNSDVWARVIDLNSGNGVGNDFRVTSSPPHMAAKDVPQVTASGSDVVIAWNASNYPAYGFLIKGRRVDMNTGLPFGSEFALSSGAYYDDGTPHQSSIALDNGRLIISWASVSTLDGYLYYYTNLLDLANNTLVGADIVLGNNNQVTTGAWGATVPFSVASNKVMFAWSRRNAIGMSSIFGRIMDISTGINLTAEFPISNQSNMLAASGPKISAITDKAFVGWSQGQIAPPYQVITQGAWIDLTAGSLVGSQQQLSPVDVFNYSLADLGRAPLGLACVMRKSDNTGAFSDIVVQTISPFQPTSLAGDPIIVSTTAISQKDTPRLKLNGNKGMVIWRGYDNINTDTNVLGRFVDLKPYYQYGLNNFFTAPMLESNYTVTAKLR